MDELTVIRDLLGEPAPPRPAVTAAARARLAGVDARARRGRARTGRYARSHARRRFPVSVAAPLGAAAAVTAVAVVLASLPHAPAAPAATSTGTGAEAGNGPASAGQTAVTARYWVQPGVVGNYQRVGQAPDRYVVLEEVAVQLWTPMSKKLPSPSIEQPLSVQPASLADQAAWRAAGSPTVWPGTGQDTSIAAPQGLTDGFSFPLKAGKGKPVAGTVGYGTAGFYWFGRQLSERQLGAVTASAAALKQFLYKQYKSAGWQGGFASYLFWALPPLITLPVSTAVRSALYQVLATQPGVQHLGEVRDVAGQRGTALAVSGHYSDCGTQLSLAGGGMQTHSTFSSCGVQELLIVNPATRLPVAVELRYTSLPSGQSWSAPDGLFSYELFGTNYWTNANPPVR
jgi:hypothetical protein